ncbi:glycyl-radical enzyme activating protein [Oscillospiraceae bacterium PP1C4]
MELLLIKKGFNYSQDGTGNRLVYHLQGCNMRCPWCSNPEGIALKGTFLVNRDQLLEEVCPFGSIQNHSINRVMCDSCQDRSCLNTRKNSGIHFSCQRVTIEDLVQEAIDCKALFFDGGGVTISGGEPTLQFDALLALLKRLKQNGIHTAIETNGSSPRLEELFDYLDLLIMDFKHYDDQIHRQFTGISNQVIQKNIGKAFAQHKNVWIRTPLIHNFNADLAFIPSFISFYHKFDTSNASFELLKYHEYGVSKWKQCDLPYTMQDGNITQELLETFEQAYQENNLRVIRT